MQSVGLSRTSFDIRHLPSFFCISDHAISFLLLTDIDTSLIFVIPFLKCGIESSLQQRGCLLRKGGWGLDCLVKQHAKRPGLTRKIQGSAAQNVESEAWVVGAMSCVAPVDEKNDDQEFQSRRLSGMPPESANKSSPCKAASSSPFRLGLKLMPSANDRSTPPLVAEGTAAEASWPAAKENPSAGSSSGSAETCVERRLAEYAG